MSQSQQPFSSQPQQPIPAELQQPQQPPLTLEQKKKNQQLGCGCLVVLVIIALVGLGSAYNSWASQNTYGVVAGNGDGHGGTVYTHTGSGYTGHYTPSGLYTVSWNCSGDSDVLVNVTNVASGDIESQWSATCNFDGSRLIYPHQPGADYYIDVIGLAHWTITVTPIDPSQSAEFGINIRGLRYTIFRHFSVSRAL